MSRREATRPIRPAESGAYERLLSRKGSTRRYQEAFAWLKKRAAARSGASANEGNATPAGGPKSSDARAIANRIIRTPALSVPYAWRTDAVCQFLGIASRSYLTPRICVP